MWSTILRKSLACDYIKVLWGIVSLIDLRLFFPCKNAKISFTVYIIDQNLATFHTQEFCLVHKHILNVSSEYEPDIMQSLQSLMIKIEIISCTISYNSELNLYLGYE
ncbi:unnamed protein product [Meganyctiphanes norvegica]|uniref:Uncharacterized protein n=1 Tax=Meganyctiphanes norvegica TaxID=48144 RepID=A0AAV2QGU5_MEGNR